MTNESRLNHELDAIDKRDFCRQRAEQEFKDGELNDELVSRIADDPWNAMALAVNWCGESNNLSIELAQRDMRATIEDVIDQRAQELQNA